MLYLDSSALVKLIRPEPESDDLADWLDAQAPAPWVSSTLAEVELARALRRTDPALMAYAPAVIDRLARYEVDGVVRAAAAAFPDPGLPSLDAIHLATASVIFGGRLTAFVTYDERLRDAAEEMKLPALSPGR